MAKRRKRAKGVPAKMASDYINTYQGIDRSKTGAYAIFQNHQRVSSLSRLKWSLNKGKVEGTPQQVPPTLGYTDARLGGLVLTPRQQAVHKSREAREGPQIDISSVSIGDRMQKVTTWNYFSVRANKFYVKPMLLYFCRDQWVFVKPSNIEGEVIYSAVYASKAEALATHKGGKVFWAGEYTVS
jgi:hypothetical protein